MKMDVWNYINYLHHEQATLKAKYENLTNLVQEIFDAVKHSEMKRIEKNFKMEVTDPEGVEHAAATAGKGKADTPIEQAEEAKRLQIEREELEAEEVERDQGHPGQAHQGQDCPAA